MQSLRFTLITFVLVCSIQLRAEILASYPLISSEHTIDLSSTTQFPAWIEKSEDHIEEYTLEDNLHTYTDKSSSFAQSSGAMAILLNTVQVVWGSNPDEFALSVTRTSLLDLRYSSFSNFTPAPSIRSTTNVSVRFSSDTAMLFNGVNRAPMEALSYTLQDQWGETEFTDLYPAHDDILSYYLPAGTYDLDIKWDDKMTSADYIYYVTNLMFSVTSYPVSTIPEPAKQSSLLGIIAISTILLRRRRKASV